MDVRRGPSGRIQGLNASETLWGFQADWSINPFAGNDNNPGTAAAPLRTMGEFNSRMAMQVIRVPAVLQLVGDVTDEPLCLQGTRFATTGSLAVRGTVTVIATGTVTNVVGLSAGSAAAFTVTTGALQAADGSVTDWVTLGQSVMLLFNDGSMGAVGRVIDATNVETGQIAGVTATFGVAPAIGQTFQVVALSAVLMPAVDAFPGTNQLGALSPQLLFQQLAFRQAGTLTLASGPSVIRFWGCDFLHVSGGNAIWGINGTLLLACLIRQQSGTLSNRGVAAQYTACVFTSAVIHTLNFSPFYFGCFHSNAPISVTFGALVRCTGLQVRNTASPITIALYGRWQNNNALLAGGNNTGVGITVRSSGGLVYGSGGSSKPTLSGSGGDTLIGNTARTYAQIPYVDLQLDAIPPVARTLVGGSASGPMPAFMCLEL
jgi:hypothetical protein